MPSLALQPFRSGNIFPSKTEIKRLLWGHSKLSNEDSWVFLEELLGSFTGPGFGYLCYLNPRGGSKGQEPRAGAVGGLQVTSRGDRRDSQAGSDCRVAGSFPVDSVGMQAPVGPCALP